MQPLIPSRKTDPDWLKVSEVARRLSVSQYQVRKWIAAGQFDEMCVFGKRLLLVSRASYQRFIEKHRKVA